MAGQDRVATLEKEARELRATIETLAASNKDLVESNKTLTKPLKVLTELLKEQTKLRQQKTNTHKEFAAEVSEERDHYKKNIKDLTFYMGFFFREKQAAVGRKFELEFERAVMQNKWLKERPIVNNMKFRAEIFDTSPPGGVVEVGPCSGMRVARPGKNGRWRPPSRS